MTGARVDFDDSIRDRRIADFFRSGEIPARFYSTYELRALIANFVPKIVDFISVSDRELLDIAQRIWAENQDLKQRNENMQEELSAAKQALRMARKPAVGAKVSKARRKKRKANRRFR